MNTTKADGARAANLEKARAAKAAKRAQERAENEYAVRAWKKERARQFGLGREMSVEWAHYHATALDIKTRNTDALTFGDMAELDDDSLRILYCYANDIMRRLLLRHINIDAYHAEALREDERRTLDAVYEAAQESKDAERDARLAAAHDEALRVDAEVEDSAHSEALREAARREKRLLDAATELLAAVKLALPVLEINTPKSDYLPIVRAAIAKAEGRDA